MLKDCSSSLVSIFPRAARAEDARDRPRREIDLRLGASGKDAGQIAGNASASDVCEGGNPAVRDDVSERRGVAQVRL